MSGCKRGMVVSLHESVPPLMNLCGVFPSPCPTLSDNGSSPALESGVWQKPLSRGWCGSRSPGLHFAQGDGQWPLSMDLLNMCIWTGVFVHFKTLFHFFLDNFTLVYNVPWSYPLAQLPAGVFTDLIGSILCGEQWPLWVHEYSGRIMVWRWHFPAFLGISRSYTLLYFHCWDAPWVLGLGC